MTRSDAPRAPLDVLGLGNAIVDVIAEADDQLLQRLDLARGTMTLVDEERVSRLYDNMGPALEMSGGSCANTMAALAALGARAAYVGKVQSDQLGEVFGHDIRATGVEFATAPLEGGPATARCLVFVTPDAQRTMATYLGACVELGPDDVDEDQVAAAQITYLEGYLWDRPAAKAACLKAAEAAHRADRWIALTLSDPFCVDRWRAEFVDLIAEHVDVLIANEAEVMSLYQTDDFDSAAAEARRNCRVAALTRGARGSAVFAGDQSAQIEAAPVAQVVDTTGAGDLYAAGFLYGLTHDLPLAACSHLGGLAAAQIIGHYGALSEHPLRSLVDAATSGTTSVPLRA